MSDTSFNDSAPLEREKTAVSYAYEGLHGWKGVRVLRLFRGMYHDVRRRLPYYWSDIKDAWDYRTIPSIVRMYFVKYVFLLMPCPKHLDLHPSSRGETRNKKKKKRATGTRD